MPLEPGKSGKVLISSQAGTGASGVLTFSDIPAGFHELELTIYGRSDVAATSASMRMAFNADATATNYNYQYVSATATTPAAAENIGAAAFVLVGFLPGATSAASQYGASKISLPEYANASGHKPVIAWVGGAFDYATGSMLTMLIGGSWESTAAITSLTMTLSAGNWTAASVARLWGIR